MKKFYTLALLASVAVSATAATPEFKTLAPKKGNVERAAKSENFIKMPVQKATLLADASIEGDYSLTIDDIYFQGGQGTVTGTANIKKNSDGTVTLSSEWFVADIVATYDEAAQTLTFTSAKLGAMQFQNGGTYYVEFQPGIWDWDQSDIVVEDYSVTFNASNGTIVFPADHNFGWMAYADASYLNSAGYVDLYDVLSLVKTEAVDEVEEGKWKAAGMATLEDGWILPSYSIDGVGVNPADYPYDVELQQSVENPNLFRLWEPYQTPECPLFNNNQSTYHGQIVFDITDPAHVWVKTGFAAGFKNNNGDFYVFDFLGWQIGGFGGSVDSETLELIYNFMEENGQPFATLEDDVITIPISVFDVSAACTSAYSWNGAQYKTSKITLPEGTGIATVTVDNNAPVEYYNLQGIKVANPAHGNVYIRCQNGVATKVIK